MWRKARRWKWQDFETELIYFPKYRLLSSWTPSILRVVESGMETPATLTWVLDMVRFCACVPRSMASDFFEFRANPLCRNQDESDRNADSRLVRPETGEISMYSWVSSADCCWWTLNCVAMPWIGEMNDVKRVGARTEHWGTPVWSSMGMDRLTEYGQWGRSWASSELDQWHRA